MFVVISKPHGIIILTVGLVLGYQRAWSVRPGLLPYGILQKSTDYTAPEDLPLLGKDWLKRRQLFTQTCPMPIGLTGLKTSTQTNKQTCPMTTLQAMGSSPCMAVLQGVDPILVASTWMGIASSLRPPVTGHRSTRHQSLVFQAPVTDWWTPVIGHWSGVVGWCEGAVYLTSLGRPTDIGLQLGKACYPCSG